MLKMMEVAMAVGYDNIRYFHSIFQRAFGMTPRRYRMDNRSGIG